MAKNSDMQLYVNGMQHAYDVTKQSGLEELENELKYRASNPLPMNVSRQELTALARIRAKEELMIVATAMAITISDDLHMPPLMVKEFLRKFNDRTDVYRMDKDKLEADQKKLDDNYFMNKICKDFLEED